MKIVDVNLENIDKEHICCVIKDKKGETCVQSKKDWMKERFKEGLVFKKMDVRGKVFIEYIPIENAWAPIEGENYMFINCLWVSGKYKGLGISSELLDSCIEDSKKRGKSGIAVLTTKKKSPFINEGSFFKHKGFIVADEADPQYELLYLQFTNESVIPKFKEHVKNVNINIPGIAVFYSNQCPYTEKYVNLINNIAIEKGIELAIKKISTKDEAQNSPSPYATYSIFYDGKFITNEILSEKKFIKYIEEWGI